MRAGVPESKAVSHCDQALLCFHGAVRMCVTSGACIAADTPFAFPEVVYTPLGIRLQWQRTSTNGAQHESIRRLLPIDAGSVNTDIVAFEPHALVGKGMQQLLNTEANAN